MSRENSDWVQPGLRVEVHRRPVDGLEGYGRGAEVQLFLIMEKIHAK